MDKKAAENSCGLHWSISGLTAAEAFSRTPVAVGDCGAEVQEEAAEAREKMEEDRDRVEIDMASTETVWFKFCEGCRCR